MAFALTNLEIVLAPYPPNFEKRLLPTYSSPHLQTIPPS